MLIGAAIELIAKPETLKTYAKSYVVSAHDYKQWACFNEIIYRESKWNPNAQNGKFYGIGQIYGSKAYTKGKPKLQVRRTLEYIEHRYDTPCNALRHHNKHGWY